MKLNKEALRQMMIILQRLPIEPDTILTNKAVDISSKKQAELELITSML
ncbi:hypothetical protein R5R42_06490 [Oenococcus oeni]